MLPNNWRYLRGDIYYADMEPHIGSEQGGKRPVVVLQNNIGNRHLFYCHKRLFWKTCICASYSIKFC